MTQAWILLGCHGIINEKDSTLPLICHLCEGGNMGQVEVPSDLVDELMQLVRAMEGGVGEFLDAHADEIRILPCRNGGKRYLTSSIESR